MSQATIAADTISAPRDSGVHKPQQFSVSTTPAEHAAWTGLGNDSNGRPLVKGSFYVNVKAIGTNIRFWFKASTATDISITSSTGYYLAQNACEPFWVNATELAALETVGDASGTLEITITSPQAGGF